MEKVAFLSVYHKEGIEKFAKNLVDLGWKIMSSSGTANYLKERKIETMDLATLVGEPILGHRVVSLSREFYAMLLSRSDNEEDMAELKKLKLPMISLVYCDMYPLKKEIEKNTPPPGLPLAKGEDKGGGREKIKLGVGYDNTRTFLKENKKISDI